MARVAGHDRTSKGPCLPLHRIRGNWRNFSHRYPFFRQNCKIFKLYPLHFLCFLFLLGGLGRDGNVLHSAEFYDIQDKKWSQVSSLKVGRTEHVMALVYGIPTVIGGKNSFLTTMKRILLYFALWGKILEQIRSFFCVLEELSFYCFHTYQLQNL